MLSKPVTVLQIEDDEVDVLNLKRTLDELKVANPLVVARDGVEALELLRGSNGRPQVERPFLILLDLNMPRMNGIEFLAELRADPELRDAIVFVMTTSRAERDKIRAYGFNPAGYLVKGDLRHSFLEAVIMLNHYWRVVEFP